MWNFFPNSFDVFEDFISHIITSVLKEATNAINDGQITDFNTKFTIKTIKDIKIITINVTIKSQPFFFLTKRIIRE